MQYSSLDTEVLLTNIKREFPEFDMFMGESHKYATEFVAALTEVTELGFFVRVVGGEFFAAFHYKNDQGSPLGWGISNDFPRAIWIALLKAMDKIREPNGEEESTNEVQLTPI